MKNNKPGCTPIVFGILGIIISIELLFKFHKWILGIIPTVFSWGDLYVSDNTRYVSYVLGGIALIISLIFFYRIWTQRSTKKAMKLGLLSLLVSCCMYMSLYIVSPSYTFKEHPYIFGYMGVRGEYIEYPRYYLWLVDNLGFYGETYKPFETLDDAILGLEYAKKNNNGMYEYIFSDLKSFGLLNVVQNIKEDDLYEDIMFEIIGVDYRDGKYNWEKESVDFFVKNLNVVTYIIENTHDDKLKRVGTYVLQKYIKYQNGEISDKDMFSKIYLESKQLYQN